jgi:IMP dehydrogenase
MNGPSCADDGFSATRLFSQGVSYTYDDVIMLPGYISFPADAVDLSTRLSRRVPLSIPCVASPMDTVSESAMAVAMASLGGAAIIHNNTPPAVQSMLVRAAKSRALPFVSNTPFYSPHDQIANFGEHEYAIVTESGTATSAFLGIVAASDWLTNTPVSVYMRKSPNSKSVSSTFNFNQVATFLETEGLDFAPLVSGDGEIIDLITTKDVERIRSYPKLGNPSVGSDGKFIVGAAIGTREEDKERLKYLVKEGINAVVVDSSQGNSTYQIDLIKYIKLNYPEIDAIGGNVVTIAQAQNLIKAGVDGLRVGMGSGSICTTQEVCAVGRGQVYFIFL